MAGAIQLTEVDFEQIKLNLIGYLKSTKEFTDYDFEGSNLQVILNLIAYQAQLNAYSTNMIANESFLASASIRDNVVSNARSLGYLPTSTRSSNSIISFSMQLAPDDYPSGYPTAIEMLPGPVFIVGSSIDSFTFNFVDVQTAPVGSTGIVNFTNRNIYEGFFIKEEFVVDKSDYNQEFILMNKRIDTSTIRVEVQENPNEQFNSFYEPANNLVELTKESRVYWIDEDNDEYYQLTFGDGYFGRSLRDGAKIHVTYLQSNGPGANGLQGTSNFGFISTKIFTSTGKQISPAATVSTVGTSSGGAELEGVDSIKFRAPKYYAAQNRAVVSSDYETLIRQIYPAVDDIYVYGGEELNIPEYGRIFVVIKPTTGVSLSNSTKNYIKNSLEPYRVGSLDIQLVDPSILYVELYIVVYYDDKNTLKDSSGVASGVRRVLSEYADSETVSKFGGAVRLSRIMCMIDNAEQSISRNNTIMRMRKDIGALVNSVASYEVCFENELKQNTSEPVVFSTGFQLSKGGFNDGKTYYFEDDSNGNLRTYYFDVTGEKIIANKTFGTVDYSKGEIMFGYVTPVQFASTVLPNNIIEIRAVPLGQDITAKQSVYLDLDIASSVIEAVVDTNILSI